MRAVFISNHRYLKSSMSLWVCSVALFSLCKEGFPLVVHVELENQISYILGCPKMRKEDGTREQDGRKRRET